MANLRPVGEGADLGNSPYFNNASQFIKQWEEMAARGIQSEEELNKLRLSNLTRLGALRREQEQQVLAAAIKANHRIIQDRMKEALKAAAREEKRDRAKLKASIEAEDRAREKAGKKPLTAEEKKALEAKLKDEFARRREHIKAQAEWEQKNKEKELKQEAAAAKRQKQKESREYGARQASDAFDLSNGKSIQERAAAIKNIFTGGGTCIC
jgi:asparagine synthetase B (glutamine-hydrolysing)